MADTISTPAPASPPAASAPPAPVAEPSVATKSSPPAADTAIAVDPHPRFQPAEDDDDNDSSLGDDKTLSTSSISSTILEYRKIHGRTYHNFETEGEYWAPNDDAQNEQLDINHHLLTIALDNKLHLAPLDKPRKALDIGTGTGIWAIDFADEFPNCEVTGIDLSPIQPTWVPPNCKFELDDASKSLSFPDNTFDYVHIRYMVGCFKDWDAVYREAYRVLKPGGWIEHMDCTAGVYSDDGSLPKDTVFKTWKELFKQAGEKMGQSFEIVEDDKFVDLIKNAGFKNVENKIIKAPVGSWPAEKKWKDVGQFNQLMLEMGIEGFGLFALTHVLGWEYNEVQVFLAKVRAALRNKAWHSYCIWGAAWGQKPLDA
ncbi:S-adenosyl-L-methionine-dependent methyltransferase [Podospora fimiseda]|uniref:S-adenosyl-L-methionine-dependent methyltransferase n=1 Tax=Podospora fimiseda TaxID=252190 RepID=A0AAN7BGB1_9PEZI|nr:S-adenosyl-L-methionine-dependent methyltransferase [Podospora fimiseda]